MKNEQESEPRKKQGRQAELYCTTLTFPDTIFS